MAEATAPPRRFFDGFNLGTLLQLFGIGAAVIGGIFSTYLAMSSRIDELSKRVERNSMQLDEINRQFMLKTEEQKTFVRELYQQITKLQETLVDVRISVAGSKPPASR